MSVRPNSMPLPNSDHTTTPILGSGVFANTQRSVRDDQELVQKLDTEVTEVIALLAKLKTKKEMLEAEISKLERR